MFSIGNIWSSTPPVTGKCYLTYTFLEKINFVYILSGWEIEIRETWFYLKHNYSISRAANKNFGGKLV